MKILSLYFFNIVADGNYSYLGDDNVDFSSLSTVLSIVPHRYAQYISTALDIFSSYFTSESVDEDYMPKDKTRVEAYMGDGEHHNFAFTIPGLRLTSPLILRILCWNYGIKT